jgi:hypothetical protein
MPSPITTLWDGIKHGLLVWPFPDATGFYPGVPLYWIAPVLLILLAVAVLTVTLVSKQPQKENR